jgi:hypothetical protein
VRKVRSANCTSKNVSIEFDQHMMLHVFSGDSLIYLDLLTLHDVNLHSKI